jgi:hypothetical protein
MPLRRARERRFIIDTVRCDARPAAYRPTLARAVSEVVWGGLLLGVAFICFYAWLAALWQAILCAVAFTALVRAALERAGSDDRQRRSRRSRLQAALRETASLLVAVDAPGLVALLSRSLRRLDFTPPRPQTGFGHGAEGMIVTANEENAVAIYYIADGAAVLDAPAVVIAAAQLARIEGARHFFAATGEFTPEAYRRAERVGIRLIDRYELAALLAGDLMSDPAWAPQPPAAPVARPKRVEAATMLVPGAGSRARRETPSLAEALAANRVRIAGHGRVLALLLPLTLLSPGSVRVYLLVLLLLNAALLVYRQWLNFRLLAETGVATAPEEPFITGGR